MIYSCHSPTSPLPHFPTSPLPHSPTSPLPHFPTPNTQPPFFTFKLFSKS
ncbi:hypothetical protein [Microcystis sp. M53602_WE12]|nr:hypothetical protein [Microcystis sp. M53602_WE12]MCZ8024656.1 hypothetical protein [Microcystis sp. LE19-10.1B]MDJ0602849.1 hypothetical protein [Microcystis sp. M53602_WE12]